MPTPRKRRTRSTSRAPRAPRSTARSAIAAALGVAARLGARTEYRIYPSIGIARVGDCEDSFLIGPEAPGVVPTGPFRGADQGLKPQAARFRIYKVEIDANENETVTEEVVSGGDVRIEWSVTLANLKAAGNRISDTLARASNPGRRNDGLDRKKLEILAAGSVTGSKTSGPGARGRYRVRASQPERCEGRRYR